MIEISPAILILLIEFLVVISIALVIVVFYGLRRRRQGRMAVAQLASQIKKQSQVRTGETGSFLKDIYQLEGDDLKEAVESIDKGEKALFQQLINSYLTEDVKIITSMDASVAELIDIYKELKPKIESAENMPDAERDEFIRKIEELNTINERLKVELDSTKITMGNMIAEFGNMFGGGSDHELASFEVAEKVGVKVDDDGDDKP